jgi:hypothetical protein
MRKIGDEPLADCQVELLPGVYRQQEAEVGILDSVLGRREQTMKYRTVDGGHPAPYPDMTDEQLYNYEVAFRVPKRTFEQPPVQRPSPSNARDRIRPSGGRQLPPRGQDVQQDVQPEVRNTQERHGPRHAAASTTRSREAYAPRMERTEPRFSDDFNDEMRPEPGAESEIGAEPSHAGVEEQTAIRTAEAPHHLPAEPLDLSKPVRTITTKQPVEIITTRARHPVYKVHGYIGDDEVVTLFTLDGRISEHGLPFLENVPQQQRLYVNVYRNPDPMSRERFILTQHETRSLADMQSLPGRLACVSVEFDQQASSPQPATGLRG